MKKNKGNAPKNEKPDFSALPKSSELHLTDKDVSNKKNEILKNQIDLPDKKITSTYEDKLKRIRELNLANKELIIANNTLYLQNETRLKRAAKLTVENKGLISANKKLIIQSEEKEKRTDELINLNIHLNKSEQKKINANRLYSVISHINKTITKVKDEQTLFKKVCKIAIEQGKFKMAWIGIADTVNKKIKLVASHGTTLSDIKILTDKTYDINGLTEHVLQGDNHFVINDTQDSEIISWSKYAKKRDFKSAISLPIIKADKVIGTFDIYSSELNFFDTEEIKMLKEITADIAFGLETFEKEKRQKESEEIIRMSEERYHSLFNNMIEAFASCKMIYKNGKPIDFIYIDVNNAFEELTGLKNVVGKKVTEVVPKIKEESPELFETYNRVALSGKSERFEIFIKPMEMWLDISVYSNQKEHFIAVFDVITNRKVTEQRKEFDKSNLNALINNTNDLMWSVDCNYKLITFNQPMFNAVKLATGKELIKGCDILSFAFTSEQSNRFKSFYDLAFNGEAFTETEYYAAGEIWTEISYCPIRLGDKVIGTACHSHDITKRKLNEIKLNELNKNLQIQTNELIESESRYGNLFYLSPQPKWVIDLQTFKFVQVNKAAIQLYGYSEAEFMKMSFQDLKKAYEIDNENVGADNLLYLDGIHNNTFWHQKKSGELIEVEIYSSPMLINGKSFRLAIAIDVTQRNIQEQEINKAITKAQEDERFEIGGELHDNVCQLLASSQISLGMLKKSLTPQNQTNYTHCKENIAQALKEIRNISHQLAPSFFENTTLDIAFRILLDSFNINDKYKIIMNYDDAIKQHPLNMDLQLNLYRILQEQLRNILKYSHATLIEVNVIIHKNKLKMCISDNGDGFIADARHVGIGFANMKRRLKLFSGILYIESSIGNGCKITIEIPVPE